MLQSMESQNCVRLCDWTTKKDSSDNFQGLYDVGLEYGSPCDFFFSVFILPLYTLILILQIKKQKFREVKSLASSLTAETHRWQSWKLNPNPLPPESACLNCV